MNKTYPKLVQYADFLKIEIGLGFYNGSIKLGLTFVTATRCAARHSPTPSPHTGNVTQPYADSFILQRYVSRIK